MPLKRSKAAVVVDTVCAWLRAAQSDADADDDGTETETPLSSQFAGAAVAPSPVVAAARSPLRTTRANASAGMKLRRRFSPLLSSDEACSQPYYVVSGFRLRQFATNQTRRSDGDPWMWTDGRMSASSITVYFIIIMSISFLR